MARKRLENGLRATSRQLTALRQLVGSGHGAPQGHREPEIAVVEAALIENHQERVQDGAVRLQNPAFPGRNQVKTRWKPGGNQPISAEMAGKP